MSIEKTTPEKWLDLLIARAGDLRKAGVTRVELDGCTVDLAPPEQPLVPLELHEEDEVRDPLSDPATYGRSGGWLPGFPRSDQ